MISPIYFKNLTFAFGFTSLKAANVIIPSYDGVTVAITVSLLFLGIFIVTRKLSSEDITKIVIGVSTLDVTDLLKLEAKLACGFRAFVELILGLMSVNQQSADKKKKI